MLASKLRYTEMVKALLELQEFESGVELYTLT